MSADAADLGEGQLVADRYRVHERIGAGGMGVVYRATDIRLKREVALKQVLLRGLDDAEHARARRRTLREAEIAARVHHPRIVSIFDVLDDAGGPLLVLEYLPSRSLGAVVADMGVLTPAVAARIGAQVADALCAAHAAGIVHRDVKPGNVLVTPGDPVGPVKLADFGISHIPDSQTLTTDGFGTPAYFAPEIARGAVATPESDVYALGATLAVITQGAPPFGWSRGNPLELISRIGADPVPDPTIGGPLGELIGRMTDADPGRRPSAAETADRLRAVADRPEPLGPSDITVPAPLDAPEPGDGGSDDPAEVSAPTHVPDGGRARPWYRRPAGLLAAGVVLALAATGVTVVATGSDPTAPGPTDVTRLPAAIPTLTIGDPRTADPCSMIDQAPLGRYGVIDPQPDYGGFASCRLGITRNGEDSIGVTAEFRPTSGTPPTGAQQRVGQALIVRSDLDGDSCLRDIVLADGTPVAIDASVDGPGAQPDEMCAIAETATVAAANRLAESGIGRRPPGESALWRTDACSLLTSADLPFLPPAKRTDTYRGFAGWKCDWSDDGDPENGVTISFDRYAPPADVGGRAVPIGGGATAYEQPESDLCNVEVARRPFLARSGDALAEVIRIKTTGTVPAQALCDRATRLMAAANPRA